MSQDGPKLPNAIFWRQVIDEVKPSLVITTGTAGGIGKDFEVGDVVVSPVVRFDCTSKLKNGPFASSHYASIAANDKLFATATSLFAANADQLPKDNPRASQIFLVKPSGLKHSVVVSDPQIKADGLTLRQQAALAAQIYKGFGRWSTVCSAIVCWALIAAEG